DFQTDTNQSKFYKIKHTLYQSTKIVPAAIIALSSFGIIAPSTLASLTMETNAQSRSIECCINNYRSQTLANTKGVKDVLVNYAEEEGSNVIRSGWRHFKALWGSDKRVYPIDNGTAFNIPAGKFKDFRGTRISLNFNHKSWVPRGSNPVKVRLTVHGVRNSTRNAIRVHLKADKKNRRDKDRGPGILQHGSVFYLKYGTNRDRAYYFVARNSAIRPEDLPRRAYFRLERM
ncbi:MAG: hypothetical protein AAF378_25035, partial [Cyanobacteria bacterium P01_A01_bin.84]